MKAVYLGSAMLVVAASVCHAQTLKEETRLLDKPVGAPQGSAVAAGAPAKVLERQGFWVRVEAAGRSGWIKASALSFSSGSGAPAAIDTGRLGTGNIVSTSSARGLSAKDLLSGAPRPDEVAKLNQMVADAASVQGFVSQGKIVALTQAVTLKAPPAAAPAPAAGRAGKTEGSTTQPVTSKKASDEW